MPLLIRGPGIPKGVSVDELAINADLAPTILDADRRRGRRRGRRPLAAAARRAPERRLRGRELLIEQQAGDDDEDANGVFYSALRNARYTYVEQRERRDRALRPRRRPVPARQPGRQPRLRRGRGGAGGAAGARCGPAPAPSCRSKPALKLKLPRSKRRDGRSCRRGGRVRRAGAGRGAPVGSCSRAFGVGAKSSGPTAPRRSGSGSRRACCAASAGRRSGSSPSWSTAARVSLQKRVRICR